MLPIVLYLKVGLDGVGVDRYVEELWGLEVNCFQYLYVGLPGLDGIEYVQGDNWLGVALSALMKIPSDRVAWLGAEALRRLAEAPLNEQQRFLLGECVQAYLPLDKQQQEDFENLLQSESYAGVRAMNQTIYEKGIEKGIEKGRQEGQRQLVCSLIEDRFGPISEGVRKSVEQLSLEHLKRLGLRIGTAASLDELDLPTVLGAPEAIGATDRHGGVPGRTRPTDIQLGAVIGECCFDAFNAARLEDLTERLLIVSSCSELMA